MNSAQSPEPIAAAVPAVKSRRLERSRLREALDEAHSYADWSSMAREFDRLTGRERWKERARSSLYDHAMIGEKLDRLRSLLEAGDTRGLMYEIEEGVHGNLGGMGKPTLHNKAYFGTKQLISDYIGTVAEALTRIDGAPPQEIPEADKLDLFRRASHCYGRTALMMSSGGMLMFFHFGVAKALFEQGVLPNVISGSSAGAIVAAVLGTRTDAELAGLFEPENLYFGEVWKPSRIERMTGLRRIFGTEAFEQTFDRLIPDLTFREAYERSGRNISISVSPCERHQTPRLLNAITSPHVLIRSAVRASCAVPGMFEPVQLMARDSSGKAVPFLKSRWIDGVFAADLPAKQLARLYGTNHYIVSYVNPVLLLTFRDHKTQGNGLKPVVDLFKGTARGALKATDRMVGKYLPASSFAAAHKVAHDLLSQDYVGDINITPQRRVFSPLRLVSPLTRREIHELMLEGQRQTWPRIEMIRLSSLISRTLDGILRRHHAPIT